MARLRRTAWPPKTHPLKVLAAFSNSDHDARYLGIRRQFVCKAPHAEWETARKTFLKIRMPGRGAINKARTRPERVHQQELFQVIRQWLLEKRLVVFMCNLLAENAMIEVGMCPSEREMPTAFLIGHI